MSDVRHLATSIDEQIETANRSRARPVVFLPGLWLLASSWDRWAARFAEAGYLPVSPGWPDDPAELDDPAVPAETSAAGIADQHIEIITRLRRKPVVIGHSFGGLIAMIIAGRGCSVTTVAIDSAPVRGVLPLPFSPLKASAPVLGSPVNRHRGIPLTFEQFRFAVATAVSEAEARHLYDEFAVPATGVPLFQAAGAVIDPWADPEIDYLRPDRGPLLIIEGEADRTSPPAVNRATYELQAQNGNVTEIASLPGRGHSLTVDGDWRGVCDTALEFVRLFA